MTLQQALRKGINAQTGGNFVEADQYYTAILKVDPTHSDANHNMGILARSLGKLSASIHFFEVAIESNPNIDQYWFSYIDTLIELSELSDAEATISKARLHNANNSEINRLEKKLIKRKIIAEKTNSRGQFDQQLLDIQRLNEIGQFDRALSKIAEISNEMRPSATLFNLKGATLQGLEEIDLSIEAFNQAIEINVSYYEAYNNLGNSLNLKGKIEEAIKAYRKALELEPNFAEAHYNMGTIYHQKSEFNHAISCYKRAISLKDNYTDAYKNIGDILMRKEKFTEAIGAYNSALSIQPDNAGIAFQIGVAQQKQHKFDEAMATYNQVLSIKPEYAEVYCNIGTMFKILEKTEAAIEAYMKALSIKPNFWEALNNIGTAYLDMGQPKKAIECFKTLISKNPNHAEAHCNLGNAMQVEGDLDTAITFFKKAIAIRPDYAQAHHNLSFALLNNGQVAQGLLEYEWRWKTPERLDTERKFSLPMWDKSISLTDKSILLWSEQGIGDTINWSSKIPFLTSQAAKCVLECQEKLVPLLRRSFPNITVIPENNNLDIERTDIDYHLPLGSLYKNVTTNSSNQHPVAAYLKANPNRVTYWKKKLNKIGKPPFVGVSWKSSNLEIKRRPNYAPISDWASIFKVPNVTFINLQYTNFEDDILQINNEFNTRVHNFEELDQFNDIDDLAALITALDMVVSTKVTPALIAAGVGTETKLAIWRQSSWSNIIHNPVGPEVKLFERNTWESWENTFERIATEMINKRS